MERMKNSMFSEETAKRQLDQEAKEATAKNEAPSKKKMLRVNVSMSEETKMKLTAIAKRKDMTVSQLIRIWANENYNL